MEYNDNGEHCHKLHVCFTIHTNFIGRNDVTKNGQAILSAIQNGNAQFGFWRVISYGSDVL